MKVGVNWMDEIIQQKKAQREAARAVAVKRTKDRQIFQSQASDFFHSIVTRNGAMINQFNSKVDAKQRVKKEVRPEWLALEKSPPYPAASGRITLDRQNQEVVCQYNYFENEGTPARTTTRRFEIRVDDGTLVLFDGNQKLSQDDDIAAIFLQDFLSNIL